ncbi:MAG TPA: hypothetical protein VFL27_01995 [Candidatus Dormibacteraeota bacterium]|nr:hypothetical protein [Candidatus Dormibacteraeota bacterium]
MEDRGRYDSAMFWLPFGTAAAVIGLALMTIGITRLAANAGVFTSGWFDGGLALLAVGVLLLLWALVLFLRRGRKALVDMRTERSSRESTETEAVRGYFAERERLFKLYEEQQKEKKGKP